MTKEIQRQIAKMQVLKYHIVIENFTPFHKYEYDVMSISKSDMICEFEVKVSRSDFKRQKEATKQFNYSKAITNGRAEQLDKSILLVPNYFSYCCPDGLIKEDEIPKFAGLYYLKDGVICEARSPKRIHSHIFKQEVIKEKILRYYSERTYLGGCRMTYDNGIAVENYNKRLADQKKNEEENSLFPLSEEQMDNIINNASQPLNPSHASTG